MKRFRIAAGWFEGNHKPAPCPNPPDRPDLTPSTDTLLSLRPRERLLPPPLQHTTHLLPNTRILPYPIVLAKPTVLRFRFKINPNQQSGPTTRSHTRAITYDHFSRVVVNRSSTTCNSFGWSYSLSPGRSDNESLDWKTVWLWMGGVKYRRERQMDMVVY